MSFVTMTPDGNTKTYEEARKLRLEENKKRLEDLGITNISKSLSEITNSKKKITQKQHLPKSRPNGILMIEPRRSTRIRNPIKSYCDEVAIDISFGRKRSHKHSSSSSWASYLARPIEEVKVASYKQRTAAFEAAEELQRSLESENPCFIKSMVRSHVYSCFWLGLPMKFCADHLPKSLTDMELEDEDGNEYDAVYIAKRTGLSGGWRAFALEHKLDDGDALVFELVEPKRFKIYIVRADIVEARDCVTEEKKKSKTTTTLGFKQQKKISAGKSKTDHVKDESETEMVNEVNGVGCADLEEVKGTRRSKRKLAM